jgi:hypothetical protein
MELVFSRRATSKQDEQSLEAGAWFVTQLAFPKAKDSYSVGAQGSVDLCVALFVAGKLLKPIQSVRLGCMAALGASVPEASVDEYGDSVVMKVKIWVARDLSGTNLPSVNAVPY